MVEKTTWYPTGRSEKYLTGWNETFSLSQRCTLGQRPARRRGCCNDTAISLVWKACMLVIAQSRSNVDEEHVFQYR